MNTPSTLDLNTEGTEAKLAMPNTDVFTNSMISSVEQYAGLFTQAIGTDGVGAFMKALADAPSLQTYGKLSMLPGTYDRGIIEWPGIPPQMLKKMAQENFIIHAVMQQRMGDIERFASESTHIWKPGWCVEMSDSLASPSKSDKKDIQDATWFIRNCNIETREDVRLRDERGYLSFRDFLKATLRDSLRYDLMTVWTDMSHDGKVKAFKPMPAGQIALCNRKTGYENDRRVFAVGRDEAGQVVHKFTRNTLCKAIRNPRTDPDAEGYGYSELEMTVKITAAFTNAFDMNADIFTRSAVPNGFLMLEGLFNQKQVEALSRIWANMRKGPSKQFSLPAVNVPKDGKISVVDLSAMAGKDGMYREYVNMMAGLYCAICNFPVHRLHYHASGTRDEESMEDKDSGFRDQADPAVSGLLDFMESFINEYLLRTRWPHLQLRFYGKNPKEDARSYEARKNAATVREMRAMADLPPLPSLTSNPEHKELMELMELAPNDPGQAGIFQSLVSVYLGQKNGDHEGKGDGARIQSKKDPAISEAHGATSGVRRDSAAESSKSVNRPLYICRDLLNVSELRDWARENGLPSIDLHAHCTVVYSKRPVDWQGVSEGPSTISVRGGERSIEKFGSAVVLRFDSADFQVAHKAWEKAGASYDFDTYKPHVTLFYDADFDVDNVRPFSGRLEFGPEIQNEPNADYTNTLESFPI